MKEAKAILREYVSESSLQLTDWTIEAMKDYARSVAKQALEDAANNATIFLPHSHYHGTKNIDKQSILDTEIKTP